MHSTWCYRLIVDRLVINLKWSLNGVPLHEILSPCTEDQLCPIKSKYFPTLGVCDVSRESIEWIVTKQGPGNAAVIVVGGAAEALEARPGNYKLTLKNRKGFVKLAMRTG